ncbi:hypothetical protein AVEN_155349-1 [Araneus ventricosus]|uniref:Uncharacterized protein n=1 Tax=Araneus ventricosus TaxID=182803 RepID=A0A4Y2U3X1_ARAVE|nr:hypothetical protein AVEN_155349-1 [Araneus ventricosus]
MHSQPLWYRDCLTPVCNSIPYTLQRISSCKWFLLLLSFRFYISRFLRNLSLLAQQVVQLIAFERTIAALNRTQVGKPLYMANPIAACEQKTSSESPF